MNYFDYTGLPPAHVINASYALSAGSAPDLTAAQTQDIATFELVRRLARAAVWKLDHHRTRTHQGDAAQAKVLRLLSQIEDAADEARDLIEIGDEG